MHKTLAVSQRINRERIEEDLKKTIQIEKEKLKSKENKVKERENEKGNEIKQKEKRMSLEKEMGNVNKCS